MSNSSVNRTNNSNAAEDPFYCFNFDPVELICLDDNMHMEWHLTPGMALSAFGIALLIVIALIGNIMVCSAFCYYRRLRTVTNYFIISLAISDLMVAAFSMPLWLSYEVSGWMDLPPWIDFLSLVHSWEIIDVLAGVSSVMNLTAISLDRFFSIIAPLRHRTRLTPAIALITISFCWVYSLAIALGRLANNNTYIILNSTLGFFVPLIVVLFCYTSIYIKFRVRSSRQGSFEGDWNLEKTLLIVTGLFVVCWLPFHLFSLLYTFCFSCSFTMVSVERISGFVKWMHYLNSCCNPIVYGFFNISFKTAFRGMLHRCLGIKYFDVEIGASSRDASSNNNSTFFRHLKNLRRKLSWKRDGEESTLTNGELNDNSIGIAMLSLHVKAKQPAEYQSGLDYEGGGSPLLERSRSSSRVSVEQGLLSDARNTSLESTIRNAVNKTPSQSESSIFNSNKMNSTEGSICDQAILSTPSRHCKASESSDDVEASNSGEDSKPLFRKKDKKKYFMSGFRPKRMLGRVPELFTRSSESYASKSPAVAVVQRKRSNSFTCMDTNNCDSDSIHNTEDRQCIDLEREDVFSVSSPEVEIVDLFLEGDQFLDSKESIV